MELILRLLCLLLSVITLTHIHAQVEGTTDVDTTFLQVLNELEAKEEVSFSFDADLISSLKIPRTFADVASLLAYLNTKSALAVEEVSDHSFLIRPKLAEVQFRFVPKDGSLEPFYLDLVRGNNEILYQNFLTDPNKPIRFAWKPQFGDTIKLISTLYDPIVIPASQLIFNLDQSMLLSEKVTYLEEVVVDNYITRGVGLDIRDHITKMQISDLALIPGETDGDILAALSTLPGINTPDSRPGNLFIRGSSTDQNLILFNHIPIYHKGHFFGSISPYNATVVSQVEVSKNGFDPGLGDRVGGSVQITSPDKIEAYQGFGFGLNTLYGTGFAKTKVGKKAAISLAARRSLPFGWIPPKLQEISTMVYSATILSDPQAGVDLDQVNVKYEDYNLNILLHPSDKRTFKISGLYTNNDTDYSIINDTLRNLESISYDNEGISVEWKQVFSPRLSSKMTTFFSSYNSAYQTRQVSLTENDDTIDLRSENALTDASLAYEVQLKQRNDDWRFGLSSQWSEVGFIYFDRPGQAEGLQINPTPERTFLHALYANYQSSRLGRFYFQAGGRLTYYQATSKAYLSPRLLLNYDAGERLTLKASAGRSYQFLSQVKYLNFGNAGFDNELWRLADNQSISVLHADQAMIGGIWSRGRLLLDFEAFSKVVRNVNYASTFRLNAETRYGTANWEVQGFDLFAKVQVGKGLALWGSYEYARQLLSFDSLASVDYVFKDNRPHRFKLGGLYQKRNLKLSYSWKMLSGLYGRSIDILAQLDEVFIQESAPPPRMMGGAPPNMGPPMRPRSRPATIDDLPERYDVFLGLDLFATYQLPSRESRKYKAVIGLSLINVLNRQNQIDQVVRGARRKFLNQRYGLGFAPNLNVTVTW
ncbi:MAG: TonB-dependent receptor [Bacteroidota bacterium]